MSAIGSSKRFMRWALLFALFPFMIQCGSDSDSSQNLPAPELRPLSTEQAADLALYLRGTRTQAAGSDEHPMAWSMINSSCEERALVMQYIAASASFPLPGKSPLMREGDITDEAVAMLAENPGIDIATINIAGPLVTEAHYKAPDGTLLAGDFLPIHWPYHKGVVVNVDGEFMVIDLSVGDEPLSIDEWAHCLVDDSVECSHLSDENYDEVRIYWNSVMSGLEIPERPEKICGYTITPLFRFRRDQDPQTDQLRWSPATMEIQCDALKYLLDEMYGITVNESDIPFYTCAYYAQPEEVLCERMDLPYCDE